MDTENNTVGSATTENHVKANRPETKMVRIPLALFEDKKFFAMFPETVQKKADKVGVKAAGGRKWGPEISVSPKEALELFKVGETIYRSSDKSIKKNIKTFGYQLRKAIADKFEMEIKNVRNYVRKPKVADQPQTQAPVQEQHMAASMPPRANIDRANVLLSSVISILQDNGQAGVAALVDQAKSEIAIPEVEHA
jgi:hypothetical protein